MITSKVGSPPRGRTLGVRSVTVAQTRDNTHACRERQLRGIGSRYVTSARPGRGVIRTVGQHTTASIKDVASEISQT